MNLTNADLEKIEPDTIDISNLPNKNDFSKYSKVTLPGNKDERSLPFL